MRRGCGSPYIPAQLPVSRLPLARVLALSESPCLSLQNIHIYGNA